MCFTRQPARPGGAVSCGGTWQRRPFSDSFLDRYLEVAGADILGSVGAYHVEGLGVQLFSRIEGDLFTVQGFPLLPFMDFLRVQGLVQS